MTLRRTDDILPLAEAVYKAAVADAGHAGDLVAQVLTAARAARHDEAIVVASHAAAWVSHEQLDNAGARRLLGQALRRAERRDLTSRLPGLLSSRAAVLSELGLFAAAEADLRRAAAVAAPERPAPLRFQAATLRANLGDVPGSLELFYDLAADTHISPDIRAKVANNLAFLEMVRGRTDVALAHAAAAEELAAVVGPALLALVAQTRALVTVRAGRLAEGLELFSRAGALYGAAGLPLGEHALEYAEALSDLRLLPEAVDAVSTAVDEFTRHRAHLMRADAQLRLSTLLLVTGDGAGAMAAARAAAATFRRQGRDAWVAKALVVVRSAQAAGRRLTARELRAFGDAAAALATSGAAADAAAAHLALGRAAIAAGDPVGASEALRTAGQLARRAPVLVRLTGHLATAHLAGLTGDPAAALRAARAGLDDLDRHRAALGSVELRALASGHGAELGVLGLRAVVPSGSAARVLAWLERTRAAALVPAAGGDAVDDGGPGSDAAMAADLEELRSLAAGAASSGQARPHGAADVGHRVRELEARIRRTSWSGDRGAGRTDGATTPSVLTGLLGDGALVEYGLLDGRLLAVVVGRGPGSARSRLVDLGPAHSLAGDVDTLLFALRRLAAPTVAGARAAAARSAADDVIARLRARLVGPLRLDPRAPLVVVPVGPLQRLPWSPMNDGPVTVAPSASSWLRTHGQRTVTTGDVVLVAGPDLPGAEQEVRALVPVHAGAEVLIPPRSTCAAVTASLTGADLAHLACHATIRADNPMFSTLTLADGPLTLHELTLRGRPPDRIVLAACDSGVQVTYAGEESLGFVSALLARGTAGLVASSVVVPDVAAVPLMRALHEGLARGDRMAAALHAARGVIDTDAPAAFATWCAFDAYGAA